MKFWALLWIICCSSLGTAWTSQNQLWPVVIGHRGMGEAHAPEPENSLPAIVAAFNQGAGAVEFDVQLTADGEVVLAHDPRLERMTNGLGCVSERALIRLRKLHLRDGTGFVHEELGMSTLSEALDEIRAFDRPDRAFLADIHIKVYDGLRGDFAGIDNGGCSNTDFQTLTLKTLAAVRTAGLLDRVIFTSFDPRVLTLIKKEAPASPVGLLTMYRPSQAIQHALQAHYEYVALNHEHYSTADVARAHKGGVKVLVWSPREAGSLEWNLKTGEVDGVITDNVPAAVKVSAGLGQR